MARKKYKLTWDRGTRRWCKRYKKKQYWIPTRDGETKDSSYSRCWQAWLKKKAEIDAGPEQQRLESILAENSNTLQVLGGLHDRGLLHPEALAVVERQLQAVRNALTTGQPYTPPPPFFVPLSPPVSKTDSLAYHAKEFLDIKCKEAESGGCSVGRYENIQRYVNYFLDWLQGDIPVNDLNGKISQSYYGHLQEVIASKKWTITYASDYWVAYKQFVRWLYTSEILDELPRNITTLHIGKVTSAVEVLTIPQVKNILSAVDGRTRLYILLMLNTGCTQVDISELKQSEVDWQRGRITRKRSKTAKHESAPVVEYPLWQETFVLIPLELEFSVV